EGEGGYQVEVSARNNATGEVAQDVVTFEFGRLVGETPTVTPTRHPLVFVYSAPSCPVGGSISVQFAPADGSGGARQTPAQDCDGRSTVNFYLAALRASTAYVAWQTVRTETAVFDGPRAPFTTGVPATQAPPSRPLSTPLPAYGDVLLQSTVNG